MEKLQGPINPCLFEEHVDERCLEEENPALGLGCYAQLLTTEDFRFEEYTDEQQQLQLQQQQTQQYTLPSLEDKMPFLQMLQSVECASFLQEPNFQLLLKLQGQDSKKMPWNSSYELESCVTNEIVDFYSSPAKSEPLHETLNLKNSGEILSSEYNQLEQTTNPSSRGKSKQTQMAKPPVSTKEKRKRKRAKLTKNKEEVESQRMTHIAVERNRRRQMNEHLNALRSIMPSSYIQRGDQASIIGGAIDFVKELEQLLQSLQAQKRMRHSEDSNGDVSTGSTSTSSSNLLTNLFMGSTSQLLPTMSPPTSTNNIPDNDGSSSAELEAPATGIQKGDEFTAENRSPAADVDVVVIQNHVNLKIQCQRKPGQLIRAILALEDLMLTVLHLNITSSESLIHYSFNLKIEEDCNLRSAAEIAGAVHQIFSLIYNLEA